MSEENVFPVLVHGPTCFTTAQAAIDEAKERNPQQVIIMGYDEDGDWFYDSNIADGPATMWLLQMAAHKLLIAGGAHD